MSQLRPNNFKLYYVAIAKHDYICSLESGPHISEELAEASKATMPDPYGACFLTIVEHEIVVSPVT